MANKKPVPKTEEGAAEVVETPQAEAPQLKYTVRKLAQNCVELFHITSSTFAGAFYGREDTELTIDEAKAIVDHFLHGGEE